MTHLSKEKSCSLSFRISMLAVSIWDIDIASHLFQLSSCGPLSLWGSCDRFESLSQPFATCLWWVKRHVQGSMVQTVWPQTLFSKPLSLPSMRHMLFKVACLICQILSIFPSGIRRRERSGRASCHQSGLDEIRRFMWDYCGIVRTTRRLARAKKRLQLVHEEIEDYYWDVKMTSDFIGAQSGDCGRSRGQQP